MVQYYAGVALHLVQCRVTKRVQCKVGGGAGQVLSTKQEVQCTFCSASQGVQCNAGSAVQGRRGCSASQGVQWKVGLGAGGLERSVLSMPP